MSVQNCRDTRLLHSSRCRKVELRETCENLWGQTEFVPRRYIRAVVLSSLFKRRKRKTDLQIRIAFRLCLLGLRFLDFLLLFVFRFLLVLCGLALGWNSRGLLVGFTVAETIPFFTVVFCRWLLQNRLSWFSFLGL
jgi:fatty acid desaturase